MKLLTLLGEERIKELVSLRIEPLDIIHGELKTLILKAENLRPLGKQAKAWREGYVEALCDIYGLTYDLSFIIVENEQKGEENGRSL